MCIRDRGVFGTFECGVKLIRKEITAHTDTECDLRLITCIHCEQYQATYKELTTHFTVCESFPLPCPAGCKKSLRRDAMKAHLEECPEDKMACKHAKIGCKAVMRRKEFKEHLENEKDAHLEQCLSWLVNSA